MWCRRTFLWIIYILVGIGISSANNCRTTYSYSLMEGYSIVAQAYHRANESFFKATRFYNALKKEKLTSMNHFLDEVKEYNSLRARNIKAGILRQYREKPLKGLIGESLSLAEVVDYVDHCLTGPLQTEVEVRSSFLTLIDNFKDSRHFEQVNVCAESLPDEVMTAHCIIHKSVLLRDALNDHLLTVLSAKVRDFVKAINSTLTAFEDCINIFIPNFTEQMMHFNASEGKSALYSLADDLALSEDEYEEQFENADIDEQDKQ